MRPDLHITPALVTRRYDQGLDSIVRLVTDLTERIADLSALHIGQPQRTIRAQHAEIKRLEQTVANKETALVEAYQLNQQLQRRIRELEKSLEGDNSTNVLTAALVKLDSHNSNQPPALASRVAEAKTNSQSAKKFSFEDWRSTRSPGRHFTGGCGAQPDYRSPA